MAALLHDLGKASVASSARLKGKLAEKNQFRHEWVSLRLFLAFVGQDGIKLAGTACQPQPARRCRIACPARYLRDELGTNAPPPFCHPAHTSAAGALAWLIVTQASQLPYL